LTNEHRVLNLKILMQMKEWEGEKNRMFHEMGFSSETSPMQDDKVKLRTIYVQVASR
jgi:hypothetical protein